jgi:hypothetical protein
MKLDRHLTLGILSTAGIVLIALTLTWSASSTGQHHEPLASYVELFSTDPLRAQHQLSDQYSGRSVTPDQAVQLVGFRPGNVDLPPKGFTCSEWVVLDMPSCKCVQAVWRRVDETYLAVFEHESSMEDWFEDDPSVWIECSKKQCRLIQVHGQLVASWRVGRNIITVVGIRDADELADIVVALS